MAQHSSREPAAYDALALRTGLVMTVACMLRHTACQKRAWPRPQVSRLPAKTMGRHSWPIKKPSARAWALCSSILQSHTRTPAPTSTR